jgi:tRNA (Thr-GGU) A37 N-methylase
MSEESFQYESIGVIWTPFESPDGMPIQPAGTDTVGTVEVHESYADGLQDLDGFSHCILLYHFHKVTGPPSLQANPFLDDEERGIFLSGHPRVRTRLACRSSRSTQSRRKK